MVCLRPWTEIHGRGLPSVEYSGVPAAYLAELGGHSKFPIYTLDDMVGKIYRMGAGIEQDVLKCVGITPYWCAGEEVYGALDRGVVEIIKWGGFTTNWNMKFHEVAAYVYAQGWQKPGMNQAIEINKDRWDGLSDKLKRILRLAIYRLNYQGVQDLATEAEYYDKWIDYGVTVTRIDDESLQKMKDCADVRMNEISDKNPLFKEIWESQKSMLGPIRKVIALKQMPVLD